MAPGGSTDYGKRIIRMSESGAFSHRAGTAIHPQDFKLVKGVYPLKGECEGEGGRDHGKVHPPRRVGGLREALEMLASRASVGCWELKTTLVQL